jgi:hypothetical protein
MFRFKVHGEVQIVIRSRRPSSASTHSDNEQGLTGSGILQLDINLSTSCWMRE